VSPNPGLDDEGSARVITNWLVSDAGVGMMASADKINTLSNLVRGSSVEGRKKRRRLGAGAALTVLLSGLLAAIGLGIVVVAFAGMTLVVIGGTAAARRLRAYRPRMRSQAHRIAAFILRCFEISLNAARTALTQIRRLGFSMFAWCRLRGPRVAEACAHQIAQARMHLATSGAAAVKRTRGAVGRMRGQLVSRPTQHLDLHREAIRLNASGTRHRRDGAYAEAVALHRLALEILPRLDDRRAVALTQNNLALALSHVGDDAEAVALFEEAAATLRDLGEKEHEGRIIANLGLAHRRHGRHEQSENVLQLALSKLTPASPAYETVEAEVRRAS
jgi:tetratricopeptide (TPR) repeat protein